METLVREPEAVEAPETATSNGHGPNGSGPHETAPETGAVARACPSCGAALAEGQDWCLECGTSSRERWSAVPGWRTAAATIAITLVLASGAVAAAYAALKSNNDAGGNGAQVAAATGTGAAATADPNAIPPPPPIDIPAETPAEKKAAAAQAAAAAAAAAPPAAATPAPPVAVPTPPPAAVPPAATTPPATTPPATDDTTTPAKRAPLTAVALDPATAAAAAYNPFNHDAAVFSPDPTLAFDGDPATAWTVQLPTPTDVATPAVGLVIDLTKATNLRRLTLTPTAPGTTIEVYATKDATAPATLDDAGWTRVANQLDVTGKTRITLGEDGTGTGKVRQVLVWFAEGPDDGTSTSVGISELKLFS